MQHNTLKICLCFIAVFGIFSCKKYLDVSPAVTKAESSVVYNNQSLATGALNGIYYDMSGNNVAAGNNSISIIAGLSADEFIAYPSSGVALLQAYQNSLTSLSGTSYLWSTLYSLIYRTNAAIEGLTNSTDLTFEVKNQLLGEAKCIRAFLYFYLTNLFGEVPLLTSTDFRMNAITPKTDSKTIYNQIVLDLKDAKVLLSDNFLALDLKTITTERVRPNKWLAAALLAKVHLFMGNYSEANSESTNVINNNSLFDTVSIDKVFLKNSKEALFQLQNVSPTFNTQEAITYSLTAPPSQLQPVSLSKNLYGAFSVNDKRKTQWIKVNVFGTDTLFSPSKYKLQTGSSASEYSVIMRLAEVYLIRSEARANLNDITGSLADVNAIQIRAGLPAYSTNDKNELLNLILKERQVELFSEWGDRWLDLKRTNQVDAVMSLVTPQKGGTWNSNWKLFPIPSSEISSNPFLKQNDGY